MIMFRYSPWLLAVLLTVTSCNNEQASSGGQPPPPEVGVAQVLSKSVQQWDEYTGRITAIDTVELRPRASGYVQRVAYKEGQDVKRGDLMFLIDPRPYRAALENAQAQLARARVAQRLEQLKITVLAANLGLTKDQLSDVQRMFGELSEKTVTSYLNVITTYRDVMDKGTAGSAAQFRAAEMNDRMQFGEYAIPARASGGPVHAGMLYKANELGHEYFQPAMDGRILSASETKAALSAKGNGSSADVVAALDRQTQALTAQSAALAQYQAQAYVVAADRSRLAAAAGSSSVNR